MRLERIGSKWDRSNRNAINDNWDRLEGIMKSIDDLVVRGQLTPAQYAHLITNLNNLVKKGEISVGDIDINRGKITESMLAEEVLEIMTGGADVSAVPKDNSITRNKLTTNSITMNQLSITNGGKNLFRGYYYGWLANWTSYDPNAYPIPLTMRAPESGYDGRLAIIPVDGGKTYSVQKLDSTTHTRIALINGEWDLTYTESTEDNLTDESVLNDTSGKPINVRVSTNSSTRYILIDVSHDGAEPRLMVEEGTEYSDYEEGGIIPKRHLEQYTTPHNLDFAQGRVTITGVKNYGPQYDSIILKDEIYLSQGDVVGLHDYEKFNINVARWDAKTDEYLGSHGRRTGETVVPSLGNYQIAVNKIDGSTITQEDIDEVRKLTYIKIGSQKSGIQRGINGVVIADIEHDFETFNMFDYDDPMNTPHTTIYDQIEGVRSANTDYVTRRRLGDSVRGVPIYNYTLKPHTYDSAGVNISRPKIVIIAGVHGNEKSTVFSVANLMNLMVNHWKDNKLIEFLRFNVDFEIIPLANPDGFSDYLRRNANDVDINRDMPAKWESIESGASSNGDGPLSQPEGQIIYDFLNEHRDANFGIDYHNMFFNDPHNTFATTVDETVNRMSHQTLINTGRKWQKKHDQFPQAENHQFGYVRQPANGTVSRQMGALGIPAVTLEISRTNPWQSSNRNQQFSVLVQDTSLELLVEFIKSAIKMAR